jgi:mono/diheme cytochrome c family protein
MDRPSGIRPEDLGVTRLLRVFVGLSVVFVVVLAVAPARSWFSEWRALQHRYNREARAANKPPIATGVQQIWKPELDIADRCSTCHLAADRAEPIAGDKLFAAHPSIPHEPRELGCSMCHAGQGRATSTAAAHGDVAHWDEPLLPRAYFEAGCGTCHSHLKVGPAALVEKGGKLVEEVKCKSCHKDLGTMGLHGFRADWHAKHVEKSAEAKGVWAAGFQPLADDEVTAVSEWLRVQVGAPRLMAAKALAHRNGCRGCHRINGVGGDDGPDLSDEGRRRVGDLDFTRVAGARTLPSWLKAHFLDPPAVVSKSQMPKLGFSDQEAEQLTLYMLSLRQRAIPEAMVPRDRVRGLKLGERDFPTDGASLFGVFCAACHGSGGSGRKFPTLLSTFPAIGEPEFLAIADDNFLRKTLMNGRPGRRMPAWGTKDGGLRSEEIDAVIKYLRSLEPTAPTFESVEAAPIDEQHGKQLFADRCAPCHGDKGEGSAVAPPLAAADNPVTHDDNRIFGTLTVGVAGTAMGSFRQLDASSLHSLIAAVRALSPTPVKRADWKASAGHAASGARLFAVNCVRCHGERGEGKEGPALANAAFLDAATDGYLTATILRGRGATAMPHFGNAAADHPQLTPSEVADTVAFLRTLPSAP